MITGIGIDIIENNRVRKVMEANPVFKETIFTEKEIAYCEKKADSALSYAARFAAKEAFMKALGTGWNHEVSWIEIETIIEDDNSPKLNIMGKTLLAMQSRNIASCFLSISHEKDYSVACVVLERS